ncbi:MAG: glycosyltransferase family 87 protein [Pseudolabrys sp.]
MPVNMASADLSPSPPPSPRRLLAVVAVALVCGYAIVLGGAWHDGQWLADPLGRPIANDFVNVWAAGDLVRQGLAADAYDWTLHKVAEVRALGYDFPDYYGWHYPPTFLAVAALLAMLPYSVALASWLAATFAAYLVVVSAILRPRAPLIVAVAWPALVWNATAGQNGCLTAALVGATLLLLPKRPLWAGLCLGLLTYKPQFGLLFPLALVAAGQWRPIATATATAIVMVLASLVAFGTAPWAAFLDGLNHTSDVVLRQGLADLNRLQSVFGLVRAHGGDMTLAWTLQGLTTAITALAVIIVWRSRAPHALKAAALATGAILATPYLYMYDLVILAIPVAFLIRDALPSRGEAVLLGLAVMAILAFPYMTTQVGLIAALLVAALIAWRLRRPARHTVASTRVQA